jgi:GNAT superfamily N-acetyltransferase
VKIETVVTYMEMRQPPGLRPSREPAPEALVLRTVRPELTFYRWLFGAVGEPWLWWSRASLSDAKLREIIHDPHVDVYVLYTDGQPAGFFELDRRTPGDVELVFCGLLPRFIGRRMGAFLVNKAIAYAWASPSTTRLWLHTCSQDHPKALDFYRKHGFKPYRQVTELVDDPRLSGAVSRSAGWLSPNLPPLQAAE